MNGTQAASEPRDRLPAEPADNDNVQLRAGRGTLAPDGRHSRGPGSGFGTVVSVGGGVSNFVGETARSQTDLGGSWSANLTLGTRAPLALELGYVGGTNGLNVAGLDPNAVMLRNGAQAALRLNGSVMSGRAMFQPFAFVGGAWQRHSVVNAGYNASAVRGRDDVFSVPFGGGLALVYDGLFVESRFTYRPTFGENFFGNADLTSWNTAVNVGAEF